MKKKILIKKYTNNEIAHKRKINNNGHRHSFKKPKKFEDGELTPLLLKIKKEVYTIENHNTNKNLNTNKFDNTQSLRFRKKNKKSAKKNYLNQKQNDKSKNFNNTQTEIYINNNQIKQIKNKVTFAYNSKQISKKIRSMRSCIKSDDRKYSKNKTRITNNTSSNYNYSNNEYWKNTLSNRYSNSKSVSLNDKERKNLTKIKNPKNSFDNNALYKKQYSNKNVSQKQIYNLQTVSIVEETNNIENNKNSKSTILDKRIEKNLLSEFGEKKFNHLIKNNTVNCSAKKFRKNNLNLIYSYNNNCNYSNRKKNMKNYFFYNNMSSSYHPRPIKKQKTLNQSYNKNFLNKKTDEKEETRKSISATKKQKIGSEYIDRYSKKISKNYTENFNSNCKKINPYKKLNNNLKKINNNKHNNNHTSRNTNLVFYKTNRHGISGKNFDYKNSIKRGKPTFDLFNKNDNNSLIHTAREKKLKFKLRNVSKSIDIANKRTNLKKKNLYKVETISSKNITDNIEEVYDFKYNISNKSAIDAFDNETTVYFLIKSNWGNLHNLQFISINLIDKSNEKIPLSNSSYVTTKPYCHSYKKGEVQILSFSFNKKYKIKNIEIINGFADSGIKNLFIQNDKGVIIWRGNVPKVNMISNKPYIILLSNYEEINRSNIFKNTKLKPSKRNSSYEFKLISPQRNNNHLMTVTNQMNTNIITKDEEDDLLRNIANKTYKNHFTYKDNQSKSKIKKNNYSHSSIDSNFLQEGTIPRDSIKMTKRENYDRDNGEDENNNIKISCNTENNDSNTNNISQININKLNSLENTKDLEQNILNTNSSVDKSVTLDTKQVSSNISKIIYSPNINENSKNVQNIKSIIIKPEYEICDKVKIKLLTNYGNPSFIGLSGIEFYDENDEQINIKSLSSIVKINQIIKNNKQKKILYNLFNGINDTIDPQYMFLTSVGQAFIEIEFKQKIKVKKIIIYNYNHPFYKDCCTRSISLLFYKNKTTLTNSYKSIYLYKTIGESGIEHPQILYYPFNKCVNLKKFKNVDKNIKLSIKNNEYIYNPLHGYYCPVYPIGYVIKIELITNWGNDSYIGIEKIQLFDEKNDEIPLCKEDEEFENIHNENSKEENIPKIFLVPENHNINPKISPMFLAKYNYFNSSKNKEGENRIYVIFYNYIILSKIHIVNYYKYDEIAAKDIKILIDDKIIFEGELNKKDNDIYFSNSFDIEDNNNINDVNYIEDDKRYKELIYNDGTKVLTLV